MFLLCLTCSMCINTAIDSISHRRYRGQNCVGISTFPSVLPHTSLASPVHFVHALHRIPNDASCLCVTMDNCVSVLHEGKEAMSHSAHTTRTQQLPLLLGQGNPQRCGCIVWKNRADRDIIGRLSPTAAGGEGRVGGESGGRESTQQRWRQWFYVLGNVFSFFQHSFLCFFLILQC